MYGKYGTIFCTARTPWMSAKVFAISPQTTRPPNAILHKTGKAVVSWGAWQTQLTPRTACQINRPVPGPHVRTEPCGCSAVDTSQCTRWQCGRTQAVFTMGPTPHSTLLLSRIVWDKLWCLCDGSETRRMEGKEVHYTHSNSLDRYKNYTSNFLPGQQPVNNPLQVLLKKTYRV